MQYCNLHNRSDGLFLGYFSLLTEVLSKYPEGVPEGSYFVNGETLSIWIWDGVSGIWIDTNRPMQSPLTGVVDNPSTYRPEVKKGEKAYFLYITPPIKDLCFAYFVNGDEPLRIAVEQTAIVSLFWDGDFWHINAVPVKLDASRMESHTEFRFRLSVSEDIPPEVDKLSINPGDEWLPQIPESSERLFLWMISAKLDCNGDFCDAEIGWSVPVRLTGDRGSTGPHGENSYCMVLSNDSHVVPCRKDGSGGYYDGAHATCYVFEGSVDISSQYTFNVIVPDGVVCTLGNQNRTVVVSDMDSDSALITFIGECFGKPALQKVFSLAKSKQGFDGDPAVTYRLSVSDIAVRQTSSGLRIPELLTAESFVQTAGDVPVLYPAYFVVEGIERNALRTVLLSATSPVSSVSFPPLEGYESFEITLYKDYSEETGFQNRLDRENVPVLCDGADGVGVTGAVLRPRGEWSSTKIYGCFSSYRDVVIYGTDRKYYAAKEGIGSIPAGILPTNTVYWEPFDDYENIATGLLLADNAYINILGTSGIRIGNYPHCWEITSGSISHRVSGLSLTAEGTLSDPDGSHLLVGDKTILSVMDGKVQTSVTETKSYTNNQIASIRFGGRNLLRNSKSVSDTPIGQAIGYTAAYRALTRTLQAGETVIFSYSGVTSNNIAGFTLYNAGDTSTQIFPANTPVTLTKSYAHFRVVVGSSVTFSVDYMKLESGTKATDWTPAPEDVQAELDGKVATTVYQTGITQLSDQISLKASQTDLNALGNRVSAAESEITLIPEKITLAVNNIQIGGRNLLKYSALNESTGWALTLGASVTTLDGVKCFKVMRNSGQTYWGAYSTAGLYEYPDEGESYTASIDVYATESQAFTFGFENNWVYKNVPKLNEWSRVSFTAVTPARKTPVVYVSFDASSTGAFYFKNYQIERGTKATDWQLAPGDNTMQLLRTGIDIESGTITLDAAKTIITGSLIVKSIQNGGINVGGNCIITSTGLITAKGATIEGKITATSGSIGGVNISDSYIGISADNSNTSGSFFAAQYFGVRQNTNYFRVDTNNSSQLQCTIYKKTDTTAALSIRNESLSSDSRLGKSITSYGSTEIYGNKALHIISCNNTVNTTTATYPYIELDGMNNEIYINLRTGSGTRIRGKLIISAEPSIGNTTQVLFQRV